MCVCLVLVFLVWGREGTLTYRNEYTYALEPPPHSADIGLSLFSFFLVVFFRVPYWSTICHWRDVLIFSRGERAKGPKTTPLGWF